MRITYDKKKNQTNKDKHGLYLYEAERLNWYTLLSMPDTRKDYGELREIGYGPIDNRLYCVVFTQRGNSYHIISFRKANKREVAEYEENSK